MAGREDPVRTLGRRQETIGRVVTNALTRLIPASGVTRRRTGRRGRGIVNGGCAGTATVLARQRIQQCQLAAAVDVQQVQVAGPLRRARDGKRLARPIVARRRTGPA